ncbi:hypothetical protein BJX64DRAFT_283905 [Aspergillus heterothallicus]
MTAAAGQRNLPIDEPDATEWNRDLMDAFREALNSDPAVDLLSVVGKRYLAAHPIGQYTHLSEAARLNFRTIFRLHDELTASPELNLREHFPSDYDRKYRWAKPKVEEKPESRLEESMQLQHTEQLEDWVRDKLQPINTASIVYPLSHEASALVDGYSGLDNEDFNEQSLAAGLKELILKSERLFKLRVRTTVVARCSDTLVVKLFPGNRDLTEYHNLQYIAENAAELPIPKPHGLAQLGDVRAMFMTYVPGTTLDKIWEHLSHEAKVSVQTQLDKIFSRLRSLRQDDGVELGGVHGEGVKDYRVTEIHAYKGITTAKAFDDLQFSTKHRASPCYVKLLRSFLDEETKSLRGSVFSHGDLKKCNIIVESEEGHSDLYTVTGIIDWKDGGFYPKYYECTTLSNGQSITHDDDWYLYAPHCISPLRFPVRWLVDRLWGNLLWNWRTDIVR